MSRLAKDDFLELSVSERIQLVEDIWDSIIKEPQAVPLSEDQTMALDERLKAYHNEPAEGSPWAVVRERIKDRK